jgi:hypothetical protein
VLFVCTKPYGVKPLLAQLAPCLQPRHLVVSIAAGVTLADMEAACQDKARVVRVMPNTPCLVGASSAPQSRILQYSRPLTPPSSRPDRRRPLPGPGRAAAPRPGRRPAAVRGGGLRAVVLPAARCAGGPSLWVPHFGSLGSLVSRGFRPAAVRGGRLSAVVPPAARCARGPSQWVPFMGPSLCGTVTTICPP